MLHKVVGGLKLLPHYPLLVMQWVMDSNFYENYAKQHVLLFRYLLKLQISSYPYISDPGSTEG